MSSSTTLLDKAEGAPFMLSNRDGQSPVVLVCEHGGNLLPARLGTLGLPEGVLNEHIAWDPGALVLSQRLSDTFDAALCHQRYSRLAYDCNRPPDAPSAIPIRSEIHAIPGNENLTPGEREARVNEIYRPFRQGLSDFLSEREAAGRRSVLVTVHSFTPVYFGQQRAVEIGILHDRDSRLADAMLDRAADVAQTYVVRRNEPYGPEDGVTHTLIEHGLNRGLPNVMIEVRNDRLREPANLDAVASYLSDLLQAGLKDL